MTSYLLPLGVSLAFAFWLLPIDFILGRGAHWAAPLADSRQHIIGVRYFLADEWRFPILQTQLIAPPGGVNILYTDSLPLFALGAKALRPVLSPQVNYFGLWYFLCFVLQGLSAAFLVRSLGVNSRLASVGATILALSFPALLHRFGQASLCGHFFLLVSLGLYFCAVREGSFCRRWMQMAVACWLALLVHPYLFVMALGIFLAADAQEALSSRSGLRRSVVALIVVGGVAALIMWVAGYSSGAIEGWGFDRFSMNALSPWVPQRSGVFPRLDTIIDATGQQREGFNYLGCGVLLLLVVALWSGRRRLVPTLRQYWALAVFLVVLALFAMSNHVYVGQHEVLSLNIDPPAIVRQFRAPGRFFWPVGYTLMAIGLAGTALNVRRPVHIAVILLAAALQVIDAGPLRRKIESIVRVGGRFRAPPEPWRNLIAAHDRLTILPSFECLGPWDPESKKWDVLDLGFHASSSATPISTTYLARSLTRVDCAAEIASLADRSIGTGELLLVLSPPVPKGVVASIPRFEELCRWCGNGFACSQKWSALPNRLTEGMTDPISGLPPYGLGTEIRFSEGGNSTDYAGAGWAAQEPWGTRSSAPEARMALHLGDAVASDLSLTASTIGIASGPIVVDVEVNGETLAGWTLHHGENPIATVMIPQSVAAASKLMRIAFRVRTPANSQAGPLGLVWLKIERTRAKEKDENKK